MKFRSLFETGSFYVLEKCRIEKISRKFFRFLLTSVEKYCIMKEYVNFYTTYCAKEQSKNGNDNNDQKA